MAAMLFLYYRDARKTKKPHQNPHISFIIPCYNDGEVVGQAIKSIFKSYDQTRMEVIVVNDCSTDHSARIIRSLQSEYDFIFMDLKKNQGKSAVLNQAIAKAQYNTITCLDADTLLNPQSVDDALRRLESDDNTALVSCPYTPSNMGTFWASMQEVEYAMLTLVQGCYNVSSTLAARGGCLVMRREPFEAVGGFELSAITEDMYLALALNRNGWRVQQSNYPVASEVPDTFHKRRKQKIRRCSGVLQAFLSHMGVWIKKPVQMIFMTSFGMLTLLGTVGLISKIWSMIEIAHAAPVLVSTASQIYNMYYDVMIASIGYAMMFMSLSLPYVFSTIKSPKQRKKLGLWIPYMFVYMNMYSLLSIYSTGVGIYKFFTLKKGVRGR